MATQKAISANDQKNNGGTIMGAGNFTSGNVTNDHSLLENVTANLQDYGSAATLAVSPTSSGNLGTTQPLSDGTFQYNAPNDRWIMQGGNQTANISGASNTVLRGAAGDKNRANSSKYVVGTQRQLDEYYWLLPSGTLTKGASAGSSYNLANGAGGNAADTGQGTWAVPGELVYMQGGKVPYQADYKPRTSN